MPKFPNLIHVTQEGAGDDAYLSVHTGGVSEVDEHAKPIAIYKLVEVGSVTIEKRFTPKGKK